MRWNGVGWDGVRVFVATRLVVIDQIVRILLVREGYIESCATATITQYRLPWMFITVSIALRITLVPAAATKDPTPQSSQVSTK